MLLIELLIFDLDGTLVDTRLDLANSVNHALKSLNLPQQPVEQILQNVGNGMLKLLERSLPSDRRPELPAAVKLFKEHYSEHLTDFSRPYPGILEILQYFRNKKMAIVSNKPEAFSRQVIEDLDLASFFPCIIGGDSLPTLKPDPAPIQHAMELMHVAPASTIMIGDSPADIQAGHAAQVRTCAVTYGYRSQEMLRAENPDMVIDSPSELIERLM